MDYKRLIIIFLVAMSGTLLWQEWQKEHSSKTPVTVNSINEEQRAPELITAGDSNEDNEVGETALMANETKEKSQDNLVSVKTDVLDVAIHRKGGAVTRAQLVNYSKSLEESQKPITLFNDDEDSRYIARSGLVSTFGPISPQEQPIFTAQKSAYSLGPDEKELAVDLVWENKNVHITKRFTFHRDSYVIDVAYFIKNKMAQSWKGHFYGELERKNNPPSTSGLFGVSSYFGASVSTENKHYQKISFKRMEKNPLSLRSTGGWIAMQQHYFLTAWVPSDSGLNRYFSKVLGDNNYAIGVVGPSVKIAPGNSETIKATLYAGPELPKVLDTIAPHLALTIDYGWLWFISIILFWLMDGIYSIVGNWGWSIVGVTLLIKLAFYRLSAASYGSMAALRALQPKMEALKEKYGDDKQGLTQATVELYKKEKVNPLGGCLPVLVQIPVFIALYWVLIESVQLRQAPFILWIRDLSVKDPYYILPLIMGLSMFVQQRLSPAPADNSQAKVMYMMPVIFTVLFLNFPAGLVLYWVVNNVLSIAQQWYIMNNHKNKAKSTAFFQKKKKKGKF